MSTQDACFGSSPRYGVEVLSLVCSLGVAMAFGLSTFGWGSLLTRAIYGSPAHSRAFCVAAGVASWVGIGGLLNATGLAFAPALDVVFLAGCLIALRESKARITGPAVEWLPTLLVLASATFLAGTLLPSAAFNVHDDFHKYFATVERMLATGSVGGNPLDMVGEHSLGAQEFLQGFIAAHFPLTYLNGFDLVFCFMFSGLLIDDIGRIAGAHVSYRTLAVLAFITINPQHVNISALYSGSMMILGVIYSGLLAARTNRDTGSAAGWKQAVPVGLLIAALVAIKATLVPFALLYLVIFFALALYSGVPRFRVVTDAAVTAAVILATLLPWAIATEVRYVSLFERGLKKMSREYHREEASTVPGLTALGFASSATRLKYGGTYRDYGVLGLTLAGTSALSVFLLARRRRKETRLEFAVSAAASSAALVSFMAIPYVYHPLQGIRYFCPLAIAVVPASLSILSPSWSVLSRVMRSRLERLAALAVVGALLAITALFSDELLTRYKVALNARTALAYDVNRQHLDHCRQAVSASARRNLRSIQSMTQESATILTWIAAPFNLDFARNRILTMPHPRSAKKLIGLDLDGTAEDLRNTVRATGARYILWQQASFGMYDVDYDLKSGVYVPRAHAVLKLRALLDEVGRTTTVDRAGHWILLDLEMDDRSRPPRPAAS